MGPKSFAHSGIARSLVLALILAGALEASLPTQDEISELISQGRYVQLRAVGENAVHENQGAPEGWYALGIAFLDGEGVLPRASYCLTRARRLLEEASRADGNDALYDWTLSSLARTAMLMDRYDEQVAIYELHDRLFKPMYAADIGWPLMKLGRIDEARRRMHQIIAEGGEGDASEAMNTLGAIDWELGNFDASYGWFKQALEKSFSTTGSYNLAAMALAKSRFEEAEQVLLRVSNNHDGTTTNPWLILSWIYLAEDRLPEAMSATHEMLGWYTNEEPWMADQKSSEVGRQVVQLMLAAGRDDEALQLTETLLNRPERHGFDSSLRYRSEVALLTIRHEALRVNRERWAEEAATSGLWDRCVLAWRRMAAGFEMWRLRRRSAALLVANCGLEASLVPYGPEEPLPQWLAAPGGESFGRLNELAMRRRRMRPVERPYQLLHIAEIELDRGDTTAALTDLRSAAATMPAAEVLLHARIEALEGRALEMAGKPQEAAPHYQAAFEKDARVFRVLSLGLPVAVFTDGKPDSLQAADMIASSPRFRYGSGFRLVLREDTGLLTARLESRNGSVLARARSAIGPRELVRHLHDVAFATKVDLSQLDWKSLDGVNEATTTVTRDTRP